MWPSIQPDKSSSATIKCKVLLGLLLSSFLLASGTYAQNRHYLPDIANGHNGTGGFKTTFILCNPSNVEATANLNISDDNGNPLPMALGGNSNSRFVISLPAGSTQFLQTDGLGDLVAGAVTVDANTNIGVSAIFSIYDGNGNFLAETGVNDSQPQSSFVFPVDTTGFFNTGLALFNITSDSVAVTMTLRDAAGQQAGSPVVMNLAPKNHLGRFIAGSGQLFPAFSNFQGTLLVQASKPITATVLRQNAAPLSYTSLPAVSTTSNQNTLYLAQVANGSYGSGSYRTSFLIFNISASPANVNLSLTDSNGNPLSLAIAGHGKQSTFNFPNLAPGASLFLQTDGSGALSTGAATIQSSVPIGAAGIYTVLDSSGTFLTETGVNCSPALSSFTMPVQVTNSFETGVGFFGASGAGTTLILQLWDATGAAIGSNVIIDLPVNGHLAKMVSELFPGISNFSGSLSAASSAGIPALSLHINTSSLSMTTLPVISASGAQYTMADTLSDQAQITTLAFDGLAMMTGNLDAQSFFPPGKVSDYFGFQYLRDNDPDNMGHNTSFLTRIANNVIYILSDAQLAQLATLATTQQNQIDLYGYQRFPLMQAFRRQLEGNIPAGSSGLNLNAVKQASRSLYLLDGQMSFDRALLYSKIIGSMDSTQRVYLDAMKGKGWNSWPDITGDQINSKMQKLPQGTAVAVMTYTSDMFSWYAGSVASDVYFCPERHGTYYGGFYIKDAPAVGHEGYSISEQLTATAGSALSDSSKGYVTADQAAAFSSLVNTQRDNLYASPASNIVTVRSQISTLLRTFKTTTGSTDDIKTQVLALSGIYGDLDGENNYSYAKVIAQVYKTLTADQKAKLTVLRKSIMSGTYSDGTSFDFSTCTTPFLYSSAITDASPLAPYINNTDYLFFEP